MLGKFIVVLLIPLIYALWTSAGTSHVVSGFILFDSSNNYQSVTLVSSSNVFTGDRVNIEWIANGSTYLHYSSIMEFFNMHLTNLFKFKKHTALTNNPLKNKILAMDAEENYQELYELSKWFSSFVKRRGYSESVRTQNGL